MIYFSPRIFIVTRFSPAPLSFTVLRILLLSAKVSDHQKPDLPCARNYLRLQAVGQYTSLTFRIATSLLTVSLINRRLFADGIGVLKRPPRALSRGGCPFQFGSTATPWKESLMCPPRWYKSPVEAQNLAFHTVKRIPPAL